MRAIYSVENRRFRVVELDADWKPGKNVAEFIAAGLYETDDKNIAVSFLNPRVNTLVQFAPKPVADDYPSRYAFEIEQEETANHPRHYRSLRDLGRDVY